MPPYARFLVFNTTGKMLAEIEPQWDSIGWRLNNVAQTKANLPWSDPKCDEALLRFGNRVLIQFSADLGLPDWGGVIDVPRTRKMGRLEPLLIYTGEQLLDWRVTEKNVVYSSATPGTIAQQLLQAENAEWPTGISLGNLYTGGDARSHEFHFHDLLRRLGELARDSGMDFHVRPVFAGGKLSFELDWLQRRGSDRRNAVWLRDGRRGAVLDATIHEHGQIANAIRLAGAGSGWGPERIHSIDQEDPVSRDLYGFREYGDTQSGVTQQATLDANAKVLRETLAYPRNRLTLTVRNTPQAPYSGYGVGDVVTVSAHVRSARWHFEAPVRIRSRALCADYTCILEVEEWLE